jgi:nicotinate-nucleotide pyrophosphorylase (carboxylating)
VVDVIAPPDPEALRRVVRAALAEDRVHHDVTTRATVPPDQQGQGAFFVKQSGVLCGLEVVRETFAQLSPNLALEVLAPDGSSVDGGHVVAEVTGPLAPMLSGERVALNLLQRLSGVATLTRAFVERAAEGGPAQITDTRKTTPGLRDLERYAVRVGGARNHRDTLADGVLIKDNHLAAAAQRGVSIEELVAATRRSAPHTQRVELEVPDAATALLALAAGVDVILLDNMAPAEMARVVEAVADGVLLEASGGVTLETVRDVAATGVQLISVGALTHSAPALDISLEIEPAAEGAR